MVKDPTKAASADAPRPVINILECKGCGRCVVACPRDALVLSEKFNERGYHYVEYTGSGCTGCGNCFYTCPEPGTFEICRPAGKASRPARTGPKGG